MKDRPNIFTMSNSTDSYVLLNFRANQLTHSERIDILMELERSVPFINKKRIHLIWNNGYAGSDLTVWSEIDIEKTIPHDEIMIFFTSKVLQNYDLPTYLHNKMNTDIHFMVFPSESYIHHVLSI